MNAPKRSGKLQRVNEIFKKNEGAAAFAVRPAVRGLIITVRDSCRRRLTW